MIEIVSEPDLNHPEEAVAYVEKLSGLLSFLDTCDADMSKANFRMDVNVSVAKKGKEKEDMGTRCEIKNLNSVARMREAITYEVIRHINSYEKKKRKTFS